MRKIDWLKVAGLVMAVWLVIFGSVENLARTMKFSLEKFSR
ncbi:MAG: hypothetical protein WC686_04220 [Candidatus Shapirobacteria bacterium]|jgi:hypothetical protein